MKYANKSHGNKIREAHAMSNEVHLLYSEHFVPTPILKSVLSQCLPNYKCIAQFTKKLLPKITPKEDKQREILIN